MPCRFCETNPCDSWTGSWCSTCRKLKNLCNVYGFERMLEIVTKCCIRNEEQLEKKIGSHKTEMIERPNTRSSVKL